MAKQPSQEHDIQNMIRNQFAGRAHVFRANVGTGWASNDIFTASHEMVVTLNRGDKVLRNPRPFATGLPEGFHDLFGWVTTEITPEMVGQKFARFWSTEVKDASKLSEWQRNFMGAVRFSGGISGVARSSEEACAVLGFEYVPEWDKARRRG